MLKKVISVFLSAAIACSMLAVTASADHESASQPGIMCNSTYYSLQHIGYISRYDNGSHIATTGNTCYIYINVYMHKKKCSCGYTEQFGLACTTTHSYCSISYSNCGAH